MISQKTIREEEFIGAKNSLKDKLNDIPMTVDQRNDIEYLIREMEEIFFRD